MPSGIELARTLRQLFHRQQQDVLSQVRRGEQPSLARWRPVAQQILSPIVHRYLLAGATDGRRELLRLAAQHNLKLRHKSYRRYARKEVSFAYSLGSFLEAFLPQDEAMDWVERAVFYFVSSIFDSTEERLREALTEHFDQGTMQKELALSLAETFSPVRATTIALTESSRAVHAGQALVAEQSGVVVGHRWLASHDACELCLGLNGMEVPFSQHFAVVGKGPYAVIVHPPAHPRCMCTVEYVLVFERPEWAQAA